MLRSKKTEVVQDLSNVCSDLNTIIITRYSGLTVSKVTELRKSLKQHGAVFKVIKNSLFKIAAANTNIPSDVANLFKGPTAIVFASEPVGVSKVLFDFTKANQSLIITGCILDKAVLDAETVEKFSKIPSFNELRAQIIGLITAPATKIARVLKLKSEQE